LTRRRLSAEDAAILSLERGNVRGHTMKVVLLGGRVGAREVCERIAERVGGDHAMCCCLRQPPLRIGRPALEGDAEFAPARHVREHRESVDADGLRRELARIMAERLPRDKPLWAIDVLLLEGGRTALAWRIHHAVADGQTAMAWMRHVLLDDGGEAEPAPARAAGGRRRMRLRALRRELGRRAERSPLDRPAGPRRAIELTSAPLDEVRAIAHALPERATVNDVVLAAVGAGLRRWLDAVGARAETLRVKVPVSLHQAAGDAANRDSFMVVDLPLAEPDPVARLSAIAAETRVRKEERDADSVDALFHDVGRLSRSLERQAEHWARSPRVFALNVSNVPGPAGELAVLGAPVEELYSVAEIANRHALRVAVVSAGGRLGFGLCADPDAVDRLDLVVAGIEDELAALAEA
jgi:diacylglycerol O-acyltransferase / wax synthase